MLVGDERSRQDVQDENVVKLYSPGAAQYTVIDYYPQTDEKKPHVRSWDFFWPKGHLGKPNRSLPQKITMYDKAGAIFSTQTYTYVFDAEDYVLRQEAHFHFPANQYPVRYYGKQYTYY